jgi:hypothetical protein
LIRDRGKIKWTAMMLPEHVKLLREWAHTNTFEKRREVDEQQLERMDEIVAEAILSEKEVEITYFQHHHHEVITGKVIAYNAFDSQLKIREAGAQTKSIPIGCLVNVQWNDGAE